MNFREYAKLCDWVVDDTGNGRLRGTDPHAIVRFEDDPEFKYPSALVVLSKGEKFQVVAVHSYLDVLLTNEEVTGIAANWWYERNQDKSWKPTVLGYE